MGVWGATPGVFELPNTKEYCLGSGVVSQPSIPLYLCASESVFGYLGWEEFLSAKTYCLGSVVALQTPIPLYPIGQQKGVFGYL